MSTSSRVLKAGMAPGSQGPVVFNYDDLQAQGESYLARVREQAARMIDDARKQADELVKNAHSKAEQAGYQAGQALAIREMDQRLQTNVNQQVKERIGHLLPALEQVSRQIEQLKADWIARWETLAVELSLAIAERLMGQKIAADPEAVKPMIQSALELASREEIVLAVHPTDWEVLGHDEGLRLLASMAGCGEVSIQHDASLSRGSCVVSTRHGEIDARLETMLDRMTSELLGTAHRLLPHQQAASTTSISGNSP